MTEHATVEMNNDEQTEAVPSHLFVELTSLAELSFPTTASSRIKYTCVSSSPRIVALGSSSGTVYLFSRYAAKNRKSLCNVPVQVIPCQEGAITLLEISPDEKCIAVATSRGLLSVLGISRNNSTTVLTSVLHMASEITCFRFSLNGSRLFAGDSLGRVSCSKLSNKLSLRSPCDMILRLDSRVVQIDHFNSQLLVSTFSRCYIYDTARQTTCQIGSKLRNGAYGACFFPNEASQNHEPAVSMGNDAAIHFAPLMFCARPGGRLWEVDNQGKVYSTHQFAGARTVFGIAGRKDFSMSSPSSGTSLSFGTVHAISDLILSVSGRILSLVDPKRAKLMLVTDIGEDIAQSCVCTNDLFLLTSDGYLRKVTLFPLEKAIEKLVFRERFMAAAQVVCGVQAMDKTYRFRLDILRDIRLRLDGSPTQGVLISELDALIDTANQFPENIKTHRSAQVARLASGIHKVVKSMENSGYEDDFTFRMPSNSRYERRRRSSRSPYDSLPRRSKSTSSVNHLSPTNGGVGNGQLVDIDLDVELGQAEDNCGTYAASQSNFSTTMDTTMSTSKSEETLVALLIEPVNSHQLDGDGGERRKNKQCNRLDESKTFQSTSGNGVSLFSVDATYIDSPTVDNSFGLTPTSLKRTLQTGGRLLIDAVQKMGDLTLTPDFGDPTVIFGQPNGFPVNRVYDTTPSEEADRSVVIGSNRVESQQESSDTLSTEDALVVRSAFNSRSRVKRTKASGKANGHVVGGSGSSGDRKTNGRSVHQECVASEVDKKIQSPPKEPLKPLRCRNCGLHNSWRFLLTTGPFVDRFDFLADNMYREGGVPINVEAWKELLLERKRQKSVSLTNDGLCLDCRNLCSSFLASSVPSATTVDVLVPVKVFDAAISDANWSTLERIFGCSKKPGVDDSHAAVGDGRDPTESFSAGDSLSTKDATSSVEGREDESGMAVSMYYNPLYDSVCGDSDSDGRWNWLSEVSLDVLLALCTKVLGDDALLDLLPHSCPDDIDGLSSDFYRFISCRIGSPSLSGKVLECIALDTTGVGEVFASESLGRQLGSRAVCIDARKFCPCCTLSLTSVVDENDQRIFVFDCGHCYHKICIVSHAKPPYSCLVCKLVPV